MFSIMEHSQSLKRIRSITSALISITVISLFVSLIRENAIWESFSYQQLQLSRMSSIVNLMPTTNVTQRDNSEPRWPDLVLFVPAFPGGEAELFKVLLRSLIFFWPKNKLKLMVLIDAEIPPATRDPFAQRIKERMRRHAKSVQVKLNYIPKEVFNSRGHDRQQLIMFWADNFTDAEYVGFLDDDSLITNSVLYEDIFDRRGRPHVIGRSPVTDVKEWGEISATSSWTDNSDIEVMRAMNYFPVVVKTSHLKIMRDNVLKYLPQFGNFDDFFRRGIMEGQRNYSQFNIMFQHLWKLKNGQYNWHFQPNSTEDNHFKQIKGVKDSMTIPKPRCVLHVVADNRKKNASFVEDILKRGFCYSLTKTQFDQGGLYSRLCTNAGYSWGVVSTVPNMDQWVFDLWDWRWDTRIIAEHKKRIAINRARNDWNEDELKLIFASGN
ncbi:uncharacterized protein LOC142350665 isoform X1 [Convolutriloba macropyga]|uniref:uncharacterized protein LOC142350665 isoform X1 n=2 Tax=Convolutriloba macropyga TaxID=536237 RepID=UPI003F527A8C